jgi:glycosyltransferase involved in cell wall biosynthesis
MSKLNYEWWFNFAASPVGGGLKRLLETARWFDQRGGGLFFVNSKLRDLPNWQKHRQNQYVFTNPSTFQKLAIIAPYLQQAIERYGIPETYFAYGQPLRQRVGQRNWLHISNALTLDRAVNLDLSTRLKNAILGHQIIHSAKYVDIYSGESEFTINLLRAHKSILTKDIVLAPNGVDNTLIGAQTTLASREKKHAITVGTYSYKALEATLQLFLDLKKHDSSLVKLHVVGPTNLLPKAVKNHEDVVCHEHKNHSQLIELLASTKVYISSSQIENSSNAALEGLMLCDSIYLSDIPSHRELLSKTGGYSNYKNALPGGQQYLCTARPLSTDGIFHTWDEVLAQMVNFG